MIKPKSKVARSERPYPIWIIQLASALEQVILAHSLEEAKATARIYLGDVAEEIDWISDETRRRWLKTSERRERQSRSAQMDHYFQFRQLPAKTDTKNQGGEVQ